MRDCYVLEAEKLLHYAGDLTHRRSGLLLWTDQGTRDVSFAVRYWLYGGDFPHHILMVEIESSIPFGPGFLPQPIHLKVTTIKFGNPVLRFICPHCRVGSNERSCERIVEQLIFTRPKRCIPFFGCHVCHRRRCRKCQRNSLPSEHRERDWWVPEAWGGGFEEFLKERIDSAPTWANLQGLK